MVILIFHPLWPHGGRENNDFHVVAILFILNYEVVL